MGWYPMIWLKLIALIGLFALCSSGLALKMTENIKVDGYGQISSETNRAAVYDRLNSYGDNQEYSRTLNSGDYEQATLETTYTYRNSKKVSDVNVSGRYEAGLTMPDGIHHSIWVQSNKSINSSSTMSYMNEDIITGKSNFDWDAQNGSLSEFVNDYSLGKKEFIASTKLSGDFSLQNKLEESQRLTYTPGVLLEIMDETEIRGINQIQELRVKVPRTITIDGKSATADVQASYLQRDAEELIRNASNEGDVIKRREDLSGALRYIDKALEIYPNDAVGYHNKGSALYLLNRTSEAIDAYKKSVQIDPEDPITIFDLAYVLFNSSRYSDSILYFNMGLEKEPTRDGGVPWRDLSQAYYYLGDLSNAESAIDNYIKRTTPDSKTYLFKAQIQYESNNSQGAADSYEIGLAMVAQTEKEKNGKVYATHYIFLGDSYLGIGNLEKAKGKINEASVAYEKAKVRYGTAKVLYPDFKDIVDASNATVDAAIQSLGQDSAGLTPAEAAPTAPPVNSTVPSTISGPANGP